MELKEILQQSKDALAKAIAEKKRNQEVMGGLGQAIIESLQPALDTIASNSKLSKDELIGAISNIQINVPKADIPQAQVEVKIPEIKVPTPQVTVNVPEIKVPDIIVPKSEVVVNVPEIKIPKLSWPDDEMNIKGWVSLMGVDLEHPLPVQLRNPDGSPFNPFENITNILNTGGGGSRHVKVDGTVPISSGESLLVNQVSGTNWSVSVADTVTVSQLSGATDSVNVVSTVGLTDTQLRASSVPIIQVSGAIDSVSVIGTVPVSVADTLGVNQVSGANWSVTATQGTSPWVVSATDLDIRDLDFATDDVSVYQISGASWSVSAALDSTNATSLYNADNRLRVSVETGGSGLTDAELRATAVPISQLSGAIWSTNVTNTVTVSATDLDIRALDVVQDEILVHQVSGSSWSTSATIQNSTLAVTQSGTWDEVGINDSGNSITIDGSVSISGSIDSVVATGAVLHDAVDTGSAPIKVGGTAIQTNPTAVADGDIVRAIRDDLGRTITRPIHARDLIQTAYVSVTTGTETTLLAGVAGAYLDLIFIKGSNNSDAAVSVDIRAVTAGNIIDTLRIPANGTAGWAPAVPWPQDATGNNWTVDGPDETGRTLTFSALFSKEI